MLIRALSAVALAAVLGLSGCSTAPQSESGKAELTSEVQDMIRKCRQNDPSISKYFETAAGYAVFPTVGKGGLGVGGAYGKGQLYAKGGELAGYCDLSQATIGLQLGGQAYSEIIFFENEAAMHRFKSGNFAFAAEASAVALKSGASANAKYADGVMVFTMGESGLMYEASIGGQKFSFQPK